MRSTRPQWLNSYWAPTFAKATKRLLLGILVVLVLVVTILLIRTASFKSRQIQVEPMAAITIDREAASQRLAQALRFQTISYLDAAQIKRDEFLALHRFLEQSFPRVHASLTKEAVEDYSLLYSWKGREPGLKPILLMAHIDVVPVESGTESNWVQPPFAGRITDGYVWGRGAMDDKAGVTGILEAVELLLQQGFQPRRPIYLAFGHDEELGGRGGASAIAALLQQRGVELEYVLDEGGVVTDGDVMGIPNQVALVGVAEKGFVSLELSTEGQGGHSAMPPTHTAVGVLSTAIYNLERNQMPGGLNGLPRQTFEYWGPEMPFVQRMVFANLWLFRPLVERRLAAKPASNAMLRTTTAATMFEGSVKDNVLPARARAVVNFRIRPGDSIASVIDHVRQTINDERVKVNVLAGLATEPSSISHIDTPGFAILQRTIRQVFPGAAVAPSLSLGATDARHYAKLSGNIYRFLPLWVQPEDRERLHGTNERISVENYMMFIRFYYQAISNSA